MHITLKVAEPQNFTQTLAEELNVSQAAAVAIADEVKEKIFLPVRKQLFDDDIDINLIKTTLPGAGIDHKPAIEYKKPGAGGKDARGESRTARRSSGENGAGPASCGTSPGRADKRNGGNSSA